MSTIQLYQYNPGVDGRGWFPLLPGTACTTTYNELWAVPLACGVPEKSLLNMKIAAFDVVQQCVPLTSDFGKYAKIGHIQAKLVTHPLADQTALGAIRNLLEQVLKFSPFWSSILLSFFVYIYTNIYIRALYKDNKTIEQNSRQEP